MLSCTLSNLGPMDHDPKPGPTWSIQVHLTLDRNTHVAGLTSPRREALSPINKGHPMKSWKFLSTFQKVSQCLGRSLQGKHLLNLKNKSRYLCEEVTRDNVSRGKECPGESSMLPMFMVFFSGLSNYIVIALFWYILFIVWTIWMAMIRSRFRVYFYEKHYKSIMYGISTPRPMFMIFSQ